MAFELQPVLYMWCRASTGWAQHGGSWGEANKAEISAANSEQVTGSTQGHDEIAVVIFSGVKVC